MFLNSDSNLNFSLLDLRVRRLGFSYYLLLPGFPGSFSVFVNFLDFKVDFLTINVKSSDILTAGFQIWVWVRVCLRVRKIKNSSLADHLYRFHGSLIESIFIRCLIQSSFVL